MKVDLDTAGYVGCLRKLYPVVAAWEDQAPSLSPNWLRELLEPRNRKPLLDRDLAWFHTSVPQERARFPFITDLPSILGAMYVMEGSKLGGQFIARHVQITLPLTQGHGDAFFRGHGSQTGSLWKEYCEMLEVQVPNAQTDKVIASAKAMFATFIEWTQVKSVMDDH